MYSIKTNISIFIKIFKIETTVFKQYPLELAASILNRITEIFLAGLLWFIIAQYSDANISPILLVSYYVIVGGLTMLSFAQPTIASKLLRNIKNGSFSAYLLRPIPAFAGFFVKTMAQAVGTLGASIVLVTIGVLIAKPNAVSWLLPVAIINMFIINYSINKLIACIGFYFGETLGLKNTISHILRLLQGIYVPIFFMPELVQNILFLSPFASSIYLPTVMLIGEQVEVWQVVSGSVWALIMLVISRYAWKKSLKSYEAIGL